MATEVRHGPDPKFKVKLARGRYSVLIEGRYTMVDGVAAAGAKRIRFESKRPPKRRAEMLALRTAFVCWFLAEWRAQGGRWTDGIRAFTQYPFRRLQRQIHEGRVHLANLRADRERKQR